MRESELRACINAQEQPQHRDVEGRGPLDSSVDAVIIGMGYVGLPLAREANAAGLSVIGLDVNHEVVDGLNHGRSHIDDVADSDVVEMLGRGFAATADASEVHRARTIVICVPTPLSGDGAPDLEPCGLRWLRWPDTPARYFGDLGIH